MVDDQVLLADCRETIAAVIADAFGIARIVGHEFEIGTVEPGELGQIVEREHAVDQKDLVIGDRQRALHETAQLNRHRRIELEPDHRTTAALLERGLVKPHQVFRLFFDFNFRVADGTEGALPLNDVAGKKPANKQRRRFLERDQTNGMIAATWQPDETIDLLRHADERIHRLAVLYPRELQRDGKAEIGNERERMRRIDSQRRQQRKHMGEEMLLQPGAFRLLEFAPIDQNDIGRRERWTKLEPALLLIAGELGDRFSDTRQLFRRREPVRALGGDALPLLALETGDAHHKKFVEVVRRDRQKAHTLQQRMLFVGRLFQDAAVEVQPGQFTIDETLRARTQAINRYRGPGPIDGGRDFLNFSNSLCAIRHCKQCLKDRRFSRQKWPVDDSSRQNCRSRQG